ncbi:MAG: hypothetical protein ACLPX7_00715 [Xanthobacteraceae bacterium]
MKLVATTVTGPFVHLLYADAATKEQATEWVEMHLKAEGDDNRRLGVIQQAALQQLRALLTAENRRFESLSDRLP